MTYLKIYNTTNTTFYMRKREFLVTFQKSKDLINMLVWLYEEQPAIIFYTNYNLGKGMFILAFTFLDYGSECIFLQILRKHCYKFYLYLKDFSTIPI